MTATERDRATRTAMLKTVVAYPRDIFETVRWHDGSPLSMGDMIMSLIMTFDRGNPESAIYDEAWVPSLEVFMETFKGIKIVSTDPLTIEYYTDAWPLDAENAIGNLNCLWPEYGFGEGAWHTVGLGVMAEARHLGAFTSDKATATDVEQFDYSSGPTLEILTDQLAAASTSRSLPYAPTMSAYVSESEINTRYANLKEWFRRHSHYWVGTGPFRLQSAFPAEGTLILERNSEFADPAAWWSRLTECPTGRCEAFLPMLYRSDG